MSFKTKSAFKQSIQGTHNAVFTGRPMSGRPSVRPSVTFRCFVQKNEDTIVGFSAAGKTIILVSEAVKFIWIFVGNYPQRGR